MKQKLLYTPFSTRLSGSARETELRLRNIFQWKKKRPPVVLLVLTLVVLLSCFGLFSCTPREEVPPTNDSIAENTPPAVEPAPTEETPVGDPEQESDAIPQVAPAPGELLEQVELTGLTLDENGQKDDTVWLLRYEKDEEFREGRVEVKINLGSGEEQSLLVEEISYVRLSAREGYLTSDQRQSVVLCLDYLGSNYGGADYYILEVKNGALELFAVDSIPDENGNSYETLYHYDLQPGTEDGLSVVRIGTLFGKWHAPEWGTLAWDNGQWNFLLDGYFTDTYALTVDDGVELTLALRGRSESVDKYRLITYYDRVQVLHGETVLQTITEDSFEPDDHCPFEYFNADASFHNVHVQDINFDGNADFGIPCNDRPSDGHCWFLYNPQTRQYDYTFSLAGTPTVDAENGRILEKWWDSEFITYNTYEYNDQGKLVLVHSEVE